MKTIAILGDKGVGKKTLSNILSCDPNNKFTISLFSDHTELINNMIHYDSIIYMLDDAFAYSVDTLHAIMSKMNYLIDEFNFRMNFMICVNKCDKLDYECKDNDDFVIEGNASDAHDAINKCLCELYEQYPKLSVINICIHMLFGKCAYVIESYKYGKEVKDKDLDFFGEFTEGKGTWKKKTDINKKNFIIGIKKNIKSDKYNNTVELFGYLEILSSLLVNIDNSISRHLYLNRYVDNIINLSSLDMIYDHIEPLFRNYSDDVLKSIYRDKINDILYKTYPLENIHSENIDECTGIMDVMRKKYDNWNKFLQIFDLKYFSDTTERFCEIYLNTVPTNSEAYIDNLKKFLPMIKKYNYRMKDMSNISKILSTNEYLRKKYIDDSSYVVTTFKQFIEDEIIEKSAVANIFKTLLMNKIKYYQTLTGDVDSIAQGLEYCYAVLHLIDDNIMDKETQFKAKIMLDNAKLNLTVKMSLYDQCFVINDNFFETYTKSILGELYLLTLLTEINMIKFKKEIEIVVGEQMGELCEGEFGQNDRLFTFNQFA